MAVLPNLNGFNCSSNNLTGPLPSSLVNPNFLFFLCQNNNLDGCIPAYSCTISPYNSSNNPLLPWQGDHTPFCAGTPQEGAPCNDGDINTVNDTISGPNCDCLGESILPDSVTFSYDCINPAAVGDTICLGVQVGALCRYRNHAILPELGYELLRLCEYN